jgi:aldose 1-epimerase
MIAVRSVDGYEALVLEAPEAELEATFVPGAGMVGCSLRHRGEELLGQRGGLAHYVEARSTMGIPLLFPWANRVARTRFEAGGTEVDLDTHPELLSLDPNGLPIHGMLAGAKGWRVDRHEATDDGAVLAASFDLGERADLLEAYPFPETIGIEATLAGPELSIETTVAAAGRPVPISFGFHPYLTLPGAERATWEVEIPVQEQLLLDDQGLPTGEREPADVESGPLGKRTFDDLFAAPQGSAPFVLTGGGRSIEVRFESGYPYAQVYAPDSDDVIAFEPMTAPVNALVSGDDLELVEPGDPYAARFSIRVTAPQ